MDDWEAPVDAFFGSKVRQKKTLDELLDKMAPTTFADSLPDIPASGHENAEVEVHTHRNFVPVQAAPKILKKKRPNVEPAAPVLKKVQFEVEKLVVAEGLVGEEKSAARKRMAIALGAAPEKSKYVNYKLFKEERVAKKQLEVAARDEPKPNQQKGHVKKTSKKKRLKRKNFEVA